MNVHLTPELENFVQAKVQSGGYNSASEVVRDALLLLEQKDELRLKQIHELQRRIDQGLGEADRGESIDGEPFLQSLIDDLDSRDAKRKAG